MQVETEEQLRDALFIRFRVFVDEQGVDAEIEKDEFDQIHSDCKHVLVFQDERPVGTGRIREKDGKGKIERVCVLQQARGLGIGEYVMNALETIARRKKYSTVTLNAQVHAQPFYEQLGYEVISSQFLEENIPHVTMQKQL